MPTSGSPRAGTVAQRDIYDLRYEGDGYDRRSTVRVLSAERALLRAATHRVLGADRAVPVLTLLDFGYGTGRVTNEFVATYPARFGWSGRDLHVVAYDVSSVGLLKAAAALTRQGFTGLPALTFDRRPDKGYVAGSLVRDVGGLVLTVTFVHAYEAAPGGECDAETQQILRLVQEAIDRDACSLCTSWYGGLGHVAGATRRLRFFEALGRATHPEGELLVAVSATGDLVEEQEEWRRRLAGGDTGGFPVERAGDTVYLTELGQPNYYHVFGKDLEQSIAATRTTGQVCWVEAVRMPDPEFRDAAAERDNYRRVRAFNERHGGREWTEREYAKLHTVVAVRSGTGIVPRGVGHVPGAG